MDTLRLLDLDIDRPAQRVSRNGEVLPVSGLSWTLLDVLLQHGTDVVDFDTLAAQVWAPAVVGEDAVSQRVKLLRQALGDDSRRPRYIRSVRGRGYQLCAPPLPASAPLAPSSRARRLGWGVGVVVVLGVAATQLLWPRSTPQGAGQSLLQRAEYYAGIGQANNNRVAITLYRQALQADPESTPARRGLSRALAAQGCLFNGTPEQLREALALAEQERQRAPGDAAAHALWGYAQDCLGDMRQAITGYSRAIELEPNDERSRASLAYLQQERGQLATALQANLSLKAPERIRFRDVQVARELELLGFTQAAADRHARNFQLYPDNVFSNIAWPRSLYLAGAPQRARQVLDEALARGTPLPQLLRLQGELALLAGDTAGAADAFERGRQLRPQQSLGQTLAALHGAQAADPAWIDRRLRQLAASAGAGAAAAGPGPCRRRGGSTTAGGRRRLPRRGVAACHAAVRPPAQRARLAGPAAAAGCRHRPATCAGAGRQLAAGRPGRAQRSAGSRNSVRMRRDCGWAKLRLNAWLVTTATTRCSGSTNT